jgi:hypothetical protein
MRNLPGDVPDPMQSAPELLRHATELLQREAERLPSVLAPAQGPGARNTGFSRSAPILPATPEAVTSLAGKPCPVTGSAAPSGKRGNEQLRAQAHELMAGVLGLLGASPIPDANHSGHGSGYGSGPRAGLQALAGHKCPITGIELPLGEIDKDRLRRQAHAFIETLLITFNDATGEKGLPSEDQVPLIHGVAPVEPGGVGRASLRVENEESLASEVTLYTSNFVADSGYEIPALRVSVTPRRVSIPPGGNASFEIAVQISQQTPRGTYSGLIQAMGNRYVKAVLTLDVL